MTMRRSFLALATLVIPAVLAAAFGDKQERQPLYQRAPEKFQQMPNPLAGDTHAIEIGRRLFDRSCASCHVPDSNGRSKGPHLKAEGLHDASPGALFWVIKSGNAAKGMPGFSQLPDKQKWQIVTYLGSLDESAVDAKASLR
jgi:mono/diheme cytochrome c family protein